MTALQQLTITINKQHAEVVEELLIGAGALTVTMTAADDQEMFQIDANTHAVKPTQSHQPMQPIDTSEHALWDTVCVTALYEQANFNPHITNIIKETLQLTQPLLSSIEPVNDCNWVHESQKHFPAQTYADRLWVGPSWETPPDNLAKVNLDPGMAFGTGTHPTTQLCLQWLADNPPLNQHVIDYGCGSGILALAAIALGAKQVTATDHDDQALEATAYNASANPTLAPSLTIIKPENITANGSTNLVLANILANPLIELKLTLQALLIPKGTLILSGILNTEIDKITHAYQSGFDIQSIETLNEWVRVVLTKQ